MVFTTCYFYFSFTSCISIVLPDNRQSFNRQRAGFHCIIGVELLHSALLKGLNGPNNTYTETKLQRLNSLSYLYI